MNTLLKPSTKSFHHKEHTKKTIHVFIAGVGAIGGTLIHQIQELRNYRYNVHISGLCNSKKVLWNPELDSIHEDFLSSEEHTDWSRITNQLIDYKDQIIFIDATGSEIVARQYLKLLSNNVHVVTPSKRANTFEQTYFDQLASEVGGNYKYETAVGAGLPVIQTINSLIETGDRITKISGVVSGTMTYIFNQLQQGIAFSEIIKTAKYEGYSEPDPRDDLSGEDVARKFLILARTSGFDFERDQITVQPLLTEEYDQYTLEEFLEAIPLLNDYWKTKNATALLNNKRLRYVGELTPEQITIGIKEVSLDSPLGGLKGTDNLIQIFSDRYPESPIVIQGPGAGKEVTAAGVLSDIIQIANTY